MKKKNFNRLLICICLVLCMIPQLLNGQKQVPLNMPGYDNEPYHYGYIIGYNQMFYSIGLRSDLDILEFTVGNTVGDGNFTFNNFSESILGHYKVNSITPSLQHGFTVGIIGDIRLAKYFSLRLIPSLSFADRKVIYTVDLYDKEGNFLDQCNKTSKTDHVSLELPLQLKCKSKRVNNYAAYVIMGTNCKFDMYRNKKENNNNNNNSSSDDRNRNGITNERFDIAAEVGTGFDFYTGFFKLGIEIKMSYGLLNVKKDVQSPFNEPLDQLHNKTFQLSFTFE